MTNLQLLSCHFRREAVAQEVIVDFPCSKRQEAPEENDIAGTSTEYETIVSHFLHVIFESSERLEQGRNCRPKVSAIPATDAVEGSKPAHRRTPLHKVEVRLYHCRILRSRPYQNADIRKTMKPKNAKGKFMPHETQNTCMRVCVPPARQVQELSQMCRCIR